MGASSPSFGSRDPSATLRYYIASIGETLGPNRDYQAEASIGAMAGYKGFRNYVLEQTCS